MPSEAHPARRIRSTTSRRVLGVNSSRLVTGGLRRSPCPQENDRSPRFWLAAPLAFNQRGLKGQKSRFAFFEEPKARAHHVARGAEATTGDLLSDKLSEMAAEADRCILAHYAHRCTKTWYSSKDAGSAGLKGILNNLPVLHDDEEILLRIGDELEIGGRVAVDDDEVGKRAGLDHAGLPWIRISRAGHRQQFTVHRRRHLEDFDWAIPVLERRQDRALMQSYWNRTIYPCPTPS